MIAPITTIITANNNVNASGATDPVVTYIVVGLCLVCLLILLYSIAESHYLEYKYKKENEQKKLEGKIYF